MFRKKQTDRLIDAWKSLDESKPGKDYDRAWSVIAAVERNSSTEEREAAREVIRKAPWKRK